MNKALIKKRNKEARLTFYAELIGWSIVGALCYATMKGLYIFTVAFFSLHSIH